MTRKLERRRGKEYRERAAAALLFVVTSPLFALCAIAIKVEGILVPDARGPVLFVEKRISRGRVIDLLKFRVLTRLAIGSLGSGPTHIGVLERRGEVTRVGRVLKQWYLDELPQLLNILRGDMFLIGTRPYPIELYEEELARGITRKRDMPAGLIGPVQASKGRDRNDQVQLDEAYWDLFQHASWWRLLAEDVRILVRSLKVQTEHKGL